MEPGQIYRTKNGRLRVKISAVRPARRWDPDTHGFVLTGKNNVEYRPCDARGISIYRSQWKGLGEDGFLKRFPVRDVDAERNLASIRTGESVPPEVGPS